MPRCCRERSFNRYFLKAQVFCRLIGEQDGQSIYRLSEFGGRRGFVSQPAKMVLDEGVSKLDYIFHAIAITAQPRNGKARIGLFVAV